jgi:voltage-gated sodium channel
MVRPEIMKNKQFAGFRERLAEIVESVRFSKFIAALIMINAITLGMETNDELMSQYGYLIGIIDRLIISVFVLEITAKLYLYRLQFFRVGWNIFDFIIISISLVPAVAYLSALRALRIFRVLRLITVMPRLRRVIAALLYAIPGMVSVLSVLMIIFYVAAVLTTQIFGASEAPEMQVLFGDIGSSMYTLFQLMTLEGWHENIAGPTMEYFPWAWSFFVPFTIITSFAVLNLFIGIIVDAMNLISDNRGSDSEEGNGELAAIREELKEIKRIVSKG